MHATEWIQQHGRRLRQISASDLRKRLDRPKRHCTWCGEPVGKGRRTWCSDDCYREFASRCDPQAIRRQVGERDNGVCCECGLDTEWLRRIIVRATRIGIASSGPQWPCPVNRNGRRNMRRRTRAKLIVEGMRSRGFKLHRHWADRQHLWEADHIVPVIEGGGLTGIDNFRTLCLACHKRASADLAARRAAARRPDRQMRLMDAN